MEGIKINKGVLILSILCLLIVNSFYGSCSNAGATGNMYTNSEANYNSLRSQISSDTARTEYDAFNQNIDYVKAALGIGFNFGNEMEWTYNNTKARKYKIRFSVGYDNNEYYYYESQFNQAANIFSQENRNSSSQNYAELFFVQTSQGASQGDSSPINYFQIEIENPFYESWGRDVTADISHLKIKKSDDTYILDDSTLLSDYTVNLLSGRNTVLRTSISATNSDFSDTTATSLEAAVQLNDYISDYKDNPTLIYHETYNGNVATVAELEFLKEQGFRSIRLPVTWYNHMDYTGTIDSEWLTELKEIVDRIISYGFYVVLDIHHDASKNGWIKADSNLFSEYEYTYRYLVLQIAEAFKMYDHHLILEGPNEVTNQQGVTASTSDRPITSEDYAIHNQLLQIFVDEIRYTGYNNKNRILQVNTYAAQKTSLPNFVLPTDSATNKILVGIHDYSIRANGRLSALEYLEGSPYLDQYHLVIGEFGIYKANPLVDKNNLMSVSVPESYNQKIPMFIWDDGGNYAIMKKQESEWDVDFNSDQVANTMLTAWRNNAISLDEVRLSLELSSNSMQINISPGQLGLSDVTVSSKTSNYTGYNVTIVPKDQDPSLENANDTSSTIEPITLPEGRTHISRSEFTTGYGLSTDSENFAPILATGNTILSTNKTSDTFDETTLTMGVKTDYTTPVSTYSRTFIITAVANNVPYTIAYDANTTDTVTNLPSTQVGSVTDLNVTLSNSTPARTRFDFVGWSLRPTSTAGEYSPGETITLDYATSNTMTLYAIWEESCEEGYICYEANGADSTISTEKQAIDAQSTTVTLQSPNFKRANYGFTGWNTASDGSGTYYGPNQTLNVQDLPYQTQGGKFYAIWKPSSGSLQDWDNCAELDLLETIALTDDRDNETYGVAKLSDRNCWITENLRLDPGTANITALNTNNPTSEFLNSAPGTVSTATDYTNQHYNDVKFNANNINISLTPNATANNNTSYWYPYGIYYTWYTATAGNGTSSVTSGSVTGDICPAGWHLPSGKDASGDFGVLDKAMGGTGGYQTTEVASNRWRSFPNNFIYSGYTVNSAPQTRGTNGYYWSNSAQSQYNSFRMYFNKNQVGPGTGNQNKYNAMPVRCLSSLRYTVEFNPNGGSGEMGNQSIGYDSPTSLASNTFMGPDRLEFASWNTKADGTGTSYSNNEVVTNIAPANEFIVLYAQWRCPADKICYRSTLASEGAMGNQDVVTGSSATLVASNFSRLGYGFAGWTTAVDGTTVYGPNETISSAQIGDLSTVGLEMHPKWIASTGTMQEFSAAQCANLASGAVIALTDSRDNSVYSVAKLQDGKCWMIENLRLDPSTANITSANTNNPSSDFLLNIGSSSSLDTWCADENETCINRISFNTSAFANRASSASYGVKNIYSYGAYYNWYTATAGNGLYATTSHTTGDICPSGWHIFTGGNTGEIKNLNDLVNSGSTTVSTGLRKYPNNFNYSGYYGTDSAQGYGGNGYYWTATGFNNVGAYRFYLSNSSVSAGTYNVAKYSGRSVRCIKNQ